MKKVNFKVRFCNALVLMIALISFVGCSKDDDNPGPDAGSIDIATGTFKGVMSIGTTNHVNAVLIVTKVDNDRLKFQAKSGEPYSNVEVKTIRAKANVPGLVDGDDSQGMFTYQIADKKLSLVSSVSGTPYTFEGAKQ